MARLSVTIDTHATTAIASTSVVRFDASSSTGTGLSYRFELGDGTIATGPSIEHVYERAGTLNFVLLTVTDSFGRVGVASHVVFVRGITGTFIGGADKPTARRRVSLWLVIESQQATNVSGFLADDDGMRVTVSGKLLPDRGITLTLANDGGNWLGLKPEGFSANAGRVILKAKGGWANGQTIDLISLTEIYSTR